MTTALAARRSCRMDVRMTPEQRSQIERAAELKGVSLTQWSLDRLLSAARRDVEDETTTRLSAEAFSRLEHALEESVPVATQALLAEEPQWA